MTIPTPEQWEEWTTSPVGQWFFVEFLPGEMGRTFAAFALRSWGSCPAQTDHAKMRERMDVLQWISRARLADFIAAVADQQALDVAMRKATKD